MEETYTQGVVETVYEHVQIIRREVDRDTGVVLSQTEEFYESPQNVELPPPSAKVETYKEKLAAVKRNRNWSEQYGPFVWVKYDICQPLCPDISAPNRSRLVLLGSMKNGDELFHVADLGLCLPSCYEALSDLAKSPYLDQGKTPEDVQDRLIWTGGVDKKKVAEDAKRARYLMRLYRKPYQELYRDNSPRGHIPLGYLLGVVPWLHRTYNIWCENPLEPQLNRVRPLSFPDLAERAGMTRGNARRLREVWPSYSLTVGSRTEVVVKEVMINRTKALILNPRLLYAGKDWHEVETLAGFERGTDHPKT